MKKITFLLVIILVVCNLAACDTDNSKQTDTSADFDIESETILSADAVKDKYELEASIDYSFDDDLLVGRVVPFTGPLRTFGESTPYIEQMAVNEINKAGGVILDNKRYKLKLICSNSNSTASGARRAAEGLIREGIDIMIVSNTDDTVGPVSAVCEREGLLCISVDAPASAWLMGGPYSNSWHTFFDNEREMLCFLDVWDKAETNKKIGLITANDAEGIEVNTFIHEFAEAYGYTIVDPGAYYVGQKDYRQFVKAFEEADCDIILGVMVNDDFSYFWNQLYKTDYRPELCSVAKATLFESDLDKLGETGDGLITEVWWSEDFPYFSSISGISSKELAAKYIEHKDYKLNNVPAVIGYKYANVEILYDILKRAGTMDLETLNKCAGETDLDTIVGHVHFNEDHVSLMPCVAGQWILGDDGSYSMEIVGNYLLPEVKLTSEIRLLNIKE